MFIEVKIDRKYIKQIEQSDIEKEITIAGWVEEIRQLGPITFLILKDSTGEIQLVAKKQNVSEQTYDLIHKIKKQDSIVVVGIIQSTKSKTNKFELIIKNIGSRFPISSTLPFDPNEKIKSGLDNRLNSRALDIKSAKNQAIFHIRHETLKIIRNFLIENNFVEVNTPKIIAEAAEGGSNLFEIDYFKRKAFLAQSPQLYKEQIIMSLDRVFEIATYFRAERSHTTKHLNEFTSVDIEAAYIDQEEAMNICEDMIVHIIKGLKENCNEYMEKLGVSLDIPKDRFERISYQKIISMLKDSGVDIKEGDDITDKSLSVLGEKSDDFYFITNWPKEIKPFYIAENKKTGESESFDLQFKNLELASGGTRIHEKNELEERIKSLNMSTENFKSHLETFSWGMPPHAGLGLGFDRLMMILTNQTNIRDVVLYPRDEYRLSP